MSINEMLMAAAGTGGGDKLYVDDCFATHLYTGTGASQTITNGIDLAGEGGMVWLKTRSAASSSRILDTVRVGGSNDAFLESNSTNAASPSGNYIVYNNNGFTITDTAIGYTGGFGDADITHASWTFRKAPKFFDVVTYTGNGTADRQVSHNLGSAPGMIIVKKTSAGGSWCVYHRSMATNINGFLNTSGAFDAYNLFGSNASQTSTYFTLGPSGNISLFNESGATYVAYLFAHDAGGFGDAGTDNIISCGSFTTDGSGNATVNLGYEPQYVLYKRTNASEGWWIQDTMRGMPVHPSDGRFLQANTTSAEGGAALVFPSATGFTVQGGLGANNPFIYMAIRRPMKKPTSGTEVFAPVTYTGNNSTAQTVNAGFPIDLALMFHRSVNIFNTCAYDRMRQPARLETPNTNAEANHTYNLASQTGINLTGVNSNYLTTPMVMQAFRRAPGFFDIVCYTGTGSDRTVAHNLGVAPELMIVKGRSNQTEWPVWTAYGVQNTNFRTLLNFTGGYIDGGSATWGIGGTTPNMTASVFSVGSDSDANASGATYVAYLFATLPGVSKVGSYTGNGSSQTINCGFTNGARFVLIKRTDASGDWCVFDTARGIVSGNDPFLQLNVNTAEVTGEDAVDPVSSGFIVNQTTEALNTNGATYIYLAIS